MIKKAVIPAAGLGTRFLPITKSFPKEMLPIIDKPCLEYIVNEAIESGITEILIVINSSKKMVVDYFSPNKELEESLRSKGKTTELQIIENIAKNVAISFIYQEEALGLGHAVLQAEQFVQNEPFAVLLGDDLFTGKVPITKQLIAQFNTQNAAILGTMEVPLEDTKKYGICIPKDGNPKELIELQGVIEKPQDNPPSRMAIAGRYILMPTIFSYLKTQSKGSQGEIQLTDAILRSLETEKVFAYNIDGKRYDIGKKSGFVSAIIDFSLARSDLAKDLKEIYEKKH